VRIITFGLIALSLWLLGSFIGQVNTAAQMDRSLAAEQANIDKLATENQQLQTTVAYVESPAYAEQIARDQLGYARDGDTILLPILPPETPAPTATPPAPVPTPVPEPNWRGWMRSFFPPASPP
jgi:hypothetical protein